MKALSLILVGFLMGLIIGIVTPHIINRSSMQIENKYIDDVDEARRFARNCRVDKGGRINPNPYQFGAWDMTCRWKETTYD